MEDIRTSWGETLPMSVEATDADIATFYIGDISLPIITSTAPFIEGVADVSVSALDMEIEPGDYSYQIKVTFDNGDIRYYPDSSCEDCSLPTVTVCPTIDMPGGS